MKEPKDVASSLLRKQAADALRRARKMPVGHARNDLRQLAMGLLWLDRKGMQAKVQDRLTTMRQLGGVGFRAMHYGEQLPDKQAPEPDPSPSEERLRVIKDYAKDLREIIKQLREQFT
jgi:hypothetical protein